MVNSKQPNTEVVYSCGCVAFDTEDKHCPIHGKSMMCYGSACNRGFKSYLEDRKLKVIKTAKFSKFLKFAKTGYDCIVVSNFETSEAWLKVFNALHSISSEDSVFSIYCGREDIDEVRNCLASIPNFPPYQGGCATVTTTTVSGQDHIYHGALLFFSTRIIRNIPKVGYLGTETQWDQYWLKQFACKQVLEFNATTPRVAFSAQARNVRCLVHTKHRSVYRSLTDEHYRSLMSENGVQPDGDGLFNDDSDKKDNKTQVQLAEVLAKES